MLYICQTISVAAVNLVDCWRCLHATGDDEARFDWMFSIAQRGGLRQTLACCTTGCDCSGVVA